MGHNPSARSLAVAAQKRILFLFNLVFSTFYLSTHIFNMKVIIALDHSEVTLKALRYYLEHLHQDSHDIIGFHLSMREQIPVGGDDKANEKLAEQCKAKEKKLLKKVEKLFNELEKDFTKFSFQVTEKLGSFDAEEIGKFILDEVKATQAEPVIMGCRGHLKLKHFLGSVSDYVVKQTMVPTLVLK